MHLSINFTALFVILAFVSFVFVFWLENRKHGFDERQTFDVLLVLSLLSIFVWRLLGYWFDRLRIFHYDAEILKVNFWLLTPVVIYLVWVVGLLFYSKRLNWSYYRFLDTFAKSQSISLLWIVPAIFSFFRDYKIFFVLLAVLLLFQIISFTQRSFTSGSTFALVTLICALGVYFVPDSSGRLPIATLLLTIALSVLYLRRKKAMQNSNITQDFLKFIKDKLHIKDGELQKQEALLKAEDPYLQPGRAEGNAEEMDEAILEDGMKELTDTKMGVVKNMRTQIKRALSFLRMGKYGVCEICGKPIDKARLSVYPEATKCVNCSSKSER